MAVTASSSGGMVCSVDRLATDAGVAVLRAGGNAVDAAVATSAALAVTTPHMCGMGGDLFALVHPGNGSHGPPAALNASGRAGSGSDAGQLRAEGHTVMPPRGDVRSCPVPGCVDGWVALHQRFGELAWEEVLGPAHRLATEGFPVSPLLEFMLPGLSDVDGCDELTGPTVESGDHLLRPGVARVLAAVMADGRTGFYGGEPGAALLAVGGGLFTLDDLDRSQADWVDPLGVDVWGHRVWTVPPNSQGYLVLGGAALAEELGLAPGEGPDPSSAEWAHLLVECARLAGHDRPAVLHDRADGQAVLDRARSGERAARFDPHRATALPHPAAPGGTIYLCTVDGDGRAVSLIQSNAAGFGAHVALPGTGILLHNRGIGFSLEPGHPAELQPGRRPPHTLSPTMVTRPDGQLRGPVGTMGGDGQPQVVLQLLARMLAAGESPGTALAAPRWVLSAEGGSGFDTWAEPDRLMVDVEVGAPEAWLSGLTGRGHRVRAVELPHGFGHAHAILVDDDGTRHGAADPRAMVGSAGVA